MCNTESTRYLISVKSAFLLHQHYYSSSSFIYLYLNTGWKWNTNKKSNWAKIKNTFFTPLGAQQSPRRPRQRKSASRESDADEDGAAAEQLETDEIAHEINNIAVTEPRSTSSLKQTQWKQTRHVKQLVD